MDTLLTYLLARVLMVELRGERVLGYSTRDGVLTLGFSAGRRLVFTRVEDKSFLYLERGKRLYGGVGWNPGVMGYDISDIGVVAGDRVLTIEFTKGDTVRRAYFELMGRRGNVVVVNDKGILLAVLREAADAKRTLRVGEPYLLPSPIRGCIAPETLSLDDMRDFLISAGLSWERLAAMTTVRNELFWRTLIERGGDLDGVLALWGKVLSGDEPLTLVDGNLIPISLRSGELFDNHLEGFTAYAVSFLECRGGRELWEELRLLQMNVQKEIAALSREQERWSNFESYSKMGEILLTYIGRVHRGMETIVLPDPMNPDVEIEIPLKTKLTPAENAERLFKLARKGKKALTSIEKRLFSAQEQLKIIEKAMEQLDAGNIEPANLLLAKKKKRKPSLALAGAEFKKKFRRFFVDGFWVLVGRNASENELLTFKVASPSDIWLHARGGSGSHTIIRCPNKQEPPVSILMKAASIAAFFSSLRGNKWVDVMWTHRRYVHRIRAGATGTVRVEHSHTLVVVPSLPTDASV